MSTTTFTATPTLKYFHNSPPHYIIPTAAADAELHAAFTSLVTTHPPLASAWASPSDENELNEDCGIYMGPAGIAYLFLHLSQDRPDLQISSKESLAWAREYLAVPRQFHPVTRRHCGIMSERLAALAIGAAVSKELATVHELLSYVTPLVSREQDGQQKSLGDDSSEVSDEWCYGFAGTLYLLRLVRTWVPTATGMIDPVIRLVIEDMLTRGPTWTMFNQGRAVLGTGHGEIGIVTQILLSDPSYAAKLEPKMRWLLEQQTEEGNWNYRSDEDDPKKRGMVQFCHGAPGFVMSLNALKRFYPDLQEGIESAVEKGRRVTWKKGVLRKEPNMCHGVLGNAFAFEPMDGLAGEEMVIEGHVKGQRHGADEDGKGGIERRAGRREAFLWYGSRAGMAWGGMGDDATTTTTTPSTTVGDTGAANTEVRSGEAVHAWEKCDYGMSYALGFGSVAGRCWAWLARDRVGGGYITYNDI